MSRIGLKLIDVPADVTVTINENSVLVKSSKSEQTVAYDPSRIEVILEGSILRVARKDEEKHTKQLHGTTRALLYNAVIGCTQGFKKELEIVGIGYHAEMKGNDICLSMGYSHTVTIKPLDGVKIECPDQTHIVVSGSDKFKVGQVAALIRDVRRPEPYLGKGIKYKDEVILRKVGKRAGVGK